MCSVMGAMIGLQFLSGVSQDKQIRQQTAAQVAAYNQQEEAANQNAKIMERQREQIAENYAREQQKLDSRRRLVMGQQIASAGASGLGGAGSLIDANASAIEEYRQNSMNLLGNQRNDTLDAYRNQINYTNQAHAARAGAANTKTQAKQQRLANWINTAVSMYGAYKTFKPGKVPKEIQGGDIPYRTGYEGNLGEGTLTYGSPKPLYTTDIWKGSYPKISLTKTKSIIGKGIGYSFDPWRV